jgi:hypothetical protein
MTPNSGLSELVSDLRTTLETISDGLVEGLATPLLDAEPRLAELAARLAASPLDLPPHPSRDEVDATQAILRRCQHLGATIRSLGEIYATSSAAGYDRSGRQQSGDASGVLQARA